MGYAERERRMRAIRRHGFVIGQRMATAVEMRGFVVPAPSPESEVSQPSAHDSWWHRLVRRFR